MRSALATRLAPACCVAGRPGAARACPGSCARAAHAARCIDAAPGGATTATGGSAAAARAVGARAAAIIGARILFMSAGLWLTVGTFAIQVFIWVFTDDDLQYWCDRCAFGKEHDKSWTPKRQEEEFFKALQAVGM